MSSIKRVENGKVSDKIESVPFGAARKLIAEGKAVDVTTSAPPTPKVQADDGSKKRIADLEAALLAEQREKVELFDELEKQAKEKADLQKRIAELEETTSSNAAKPASGGGKTK